jgi:hypothetical protein
LGQGVSFVPGDRNGHGLIIAPPDVSVKEAVAGEPRRSAID